MVHWSSAAVRHRARVKAERKSVLDQDLLERSVVAATAEVFSMMLGMEVRPRDAAAESQMGGPGIISLIGITGEWGGSGVFCCSPAFAGLLSGRMLGIEPYPGAETQAIDEEVLDVVAEITNMTIGNVKNALEPVTGPLAISVPTVIHGRNFEFRNVAGLRGVAVAFEAAAHTFEVRISLAPMVGRAGARFRIPVFGLSHV
jgi:CheY-specific phosphatase CheX